MAIDPSVVAAFQSTLPGATRLPPSVQIPEPTGDPLQDSMNLQAVLANAINSGLPDNERATAFSAYQAVSDDVARLMKEREQWNAEQAQKQAKYDEPPKETSVTGAGSGDQYILTRMPDGSLRREVNPNYVDPVARAAALRAPEKTPEQIYQEEKAKIKAQRENFEWRASQGYEPTPEETEAFRAATLKSLETIRQANALALQAQQGADARALAAEQSRLRVQEFETTEKPYKEEDLRLKREASDLARGQAQAGVLAKQAEAGQEMVKSMVGWAAPSIETVRAAYSPLQTALRILNSGTRTNTAPPSVTAPPPIQPAPNPA